MTTLAALIDHCTDFLVSQGYIIVKPADTKRFTSTGHLTPSAACSYAANELAGMFDYGAVIARGQAVDGERDTSCSLFGDPYVAKRLLGDVVQQFFMEDDDDGDGE